MGRKPRGGSIPLLGTISCGMSIVSTTVKNTPPNLRSNMIERQIRTWEVLDERVLQLYYEIPRDEFALGDLCSLAYADTMLPCGEGQFMLEPKLEARMLQELDTRMNERVLHIGTGSGFFCALLSRLCASVVSLEIRPELAKTARQRLRSCGARNVEIVTGDGFSGNDGAAPFDAIVLTGSLPLVPASLLERLAPDGRLLAPVGDPPVLALRLLKRVGNGSVSNDILETWVPALDNAPQPERFEF